MLGNNSCGIHSLLSGKYGLGLRTSFLIYFYSNGSSKYSSKGGWTMAIAVGDDLQRSHAPVPLVATAPNAETPVSESVVLDDASAKIASIEKTAKWMWVGYAVLSVLIVGYLVSVLVRTPAQNWTWLDGWSCAASNSAPRSSASFADSTRIRAASPRWPWGSRSSRGRSATCS